MKKKTVKMVLAVVSLGCKFLENMGDRYYPGHFPGVWICDLV